MPTATNPGVADFEGNRGLLTQQQPHASDPNSFLIYTDIYNDQAGRRRKRPGIGTPIQNVAAGGVVLQGQFHEFTKVSPTTGAITYYKFRAWGSVIERWNDGTSAWDTCVLGGVAFTGTSWQFCSSRNRCYAINGVDGIFYFDGTTGPDGREWYVVGIAAPVTSIGYSLAVVDAPYTTGTVSVTKGGKTVTGSGATTWVTGGAWNGKFMTIAGVRYTIASVSVASPGSLTLVEEYAGETAAGVLYTIFPGLMDWDEPPWYGYSYINAATGHSSNISPILQITEKNVVGRTVRITGIPYSPTDFNNGYDKIQIWRTARDGVVLVNILPAAGGQINNSSGAGTTTFTETANTYRDVDLGEQAAPIVSNRKPLNGTNSAPIAASSIAEWNGRLWVTAPREAKLYYSALSAEIGFGRSDECWPANNALDVADPRGVLRVGQDGGDTLLVQTGSKSRIVVGNNILNYDTRALGTDEQGGSFRGGAIAVGGTFLQLYEDKRLLDNTNDASLIETPVQRRAADRPNIGRDIQPDLNAIPAAQLSQSALARFVFQEYNLLFVSVALAAGDNTITYVFDYNNSTWYRWSIGFSAFAVVHNVAAGNALELWGVRASDKKVYRLLQPNVFTDNGANFTPAMRSAIIRPFGYGQQAFFKWFKLYINDPANAWQVKIYADEDTTGQQFPADVPNFRWQSANGKELILPASQAAKKTGEVFQFDTIWPTTATDLWIEKQQATFSLEQDVQVRQ